MNKLFKFALAALPMLMLASCAKDDLESGVPKAEKSETRYLKVTLSNAIATPDTRAGIVGDEGQYEDGTVEENKIRTLEFYFYTRDKQFHSYVPMTVTAMPLDPTDNPRGDDTTNEDGTVTPAPNPNIGSFYHCNVPVEIIQGEEVPAYALCIVNSVSGSSYQGMTMEEAQKVTLQDIYGSIHSTGYDDKGNAIGNADYFGMSNSVYYGPDPATGDNGVLVMAAPFTADKLLTESQLKKLSTQSEGTGANKNEIEDYTINIPVERYATKVNLDLSPLTEATNLPPYTVYSSAETPSASGEETRAEGDAGKATETPIKITFTPEKWAVNATEKTFYFLKSFRSPATDSTGELTGKPSDTFATESDLNSLLFTGWNKSTHKRCFWARTPGYYTNNYPVVSDDVLDNRDDGDVKNDYDLEYVSYTQCKPITDLANPMSDYKMETTMQIGRLTGAGLSEQYLPTSSMPAIVVVGRYTVEGVAPKTDFYLYGKVSDGTDKIYSGEETLIPYTSRIKGQMLYDQTILLKRVQTGTTVDGQPIYGYPAINTKTELDKINVNLYGLFSVIHPDKDVRGAFASAQSVSGRSLKIAADIAVLQLTGVPASGATGLYFYNPNRSTYEEVTGDNLAQINLLLLQNLGGAHYYKQGMAFFSAPIQHWGWYRSDNANRYKKDADGNNTNEALPWTEWNWQAMKTGDFGIVRNHIYTMKIGSIKGLGTGIADPDVPIVPPADKVKYAVHFHVNIQRWAVLPTQEWNW